MTDRPLEARCDNCAQTRPLFLYEADHDFHPTGRTCEWCTRKQPLLCTRCWSTEKQREENAPVHPDDEAAASWLIGALAANRRYAEQVAADKAACDGIADATDRPSA